MSVSLLEGGEDGNDDDKHQRKEPTVLASVQRTDLLAESWELLTDTLTPNISSRAARLVITFKVCAPRVGLWLAMVIV